jgi:SSS family solute:Na+ symporter
MRREAAARGLKTVGDYLEQRYSTSVRVIVALLLWFGTLAILAGQLIAISTLLTVVAGLPKWAGCVLGGVVMTAYFAAGGLLSSAWVNLLQLTVLLAGFAVAVPVALGTPAGGRVVALVRPGRDRPGPGDGFWNLAEWGLGVEVPRLLGPASSSPGLLQKIFGAATTARCGRDGGERHLLLRLRAAAGGDHRARLHRVGEHSWRSPPADVRCPGGGDWAGGAFLAEVSTDAILFMPPRRCRRTCIAASAPGATDRRSCGWRGRRWPAECWGLLALVAQTIIGTLSFFYSVLGVCLFVPVLAGLFVKRFRAPEALAAIAGGMLVMMALQLTVGPKGLGGFTPALAGVLTSVTVAALAFLAMRRVG